MRYIRGTKPGGWIVGAELMFLPFRLRDLHSCRVIVERLGSCPLERLKIGNR